MERATIIHSLPARLSDEPPRSGILLRNTSEWSPPDNFSVDLFEAFVAFRFVALSHVFNPYATL